jgi:hypothetical protein
MAMSDASQGPGWWVASDGKWYPPESHPDYLPPAPPPPPTASPPVAQTPLAGGQIRPDTAPTAFGTQGTQILPADQVPSISQGQPNRKRTGFIVAGSIVGAIILIIVVAAVSSHKSNTTAAVNPTSGAAPSTTTTTDPTAAAAAAYVSAYNSMIGAENPEITAQNADGSDPTAQSNDINSRITTRQTFDTAVQAITFPNADQADAQKVISADAALENALGQLSANTDDAGNYNSIFATVTTAEAQFAAADAALSSDLGLTSVTTTTG